MRNAYVEERPYRTRVVGPVERSEAGIQAIDVEARRQEESRRRYAAAGHAHGSREVARAALVELVERARNPHVQVGVLGADAMAELPRQRRAAADERAFALRVVAARRELAED